MCWIADPLWPKVLDPGPLPHWNQIGLATLLIRFMLIFVASCLKRLQLVRAKKQVTHTFKPPPVRRFKVTAIYFIHLLWNCHFSCASWNSHFVFTSHEIAIFYSPLMKTIFLFTFYVDGNYPRFGNGEVGTVHCLRLNPALRKNEWVYGNVKHIYCCEQCCGSLFDPWIRDPGWIKNQDPVPGNGIYTARNMFSDSLETIFFLLKILFFWRIRDPEYFWPWIRHPVWKNSEPDP